MNYLSGSLTTNHGSFIFAIIIKAICLPLKDPSQAPIFNSVIELLSYILFDFVSQINGVFAGHTALQAASQNGAVEVVNLLIRNGVDLESKVSGLTSFRVLQ